MAHNPESASTKEKLRRTGAALALAAAAFTAVGCGETSQATPPDAGQVVATAENTPTPTPDIIVERVAPEMVPYFITDEQRQRLTDESLVVRDNVYGETLIPAIQAYIDNLVANPDDMDSVDTSTVAASPDADIIIQLKNLVRESVGDINFSNFFVCPTYEGPYAKEGAKPICDLFNTSKFPIEGIPTSDIAISRSMAGDNWAENEENQIWIKTTNQPVVTESGQIVFN